MSVFSSVYAHILWRFIKMNLINFLLLKTNSIKYCMSLDSYSTRQAVTFSSFVKNHKIKIPKTFIELFFYGSWISWAWTHDTSLDSYLWRFIRKNLWAFIELTPAVRFFETWHTSCLFSNAVSYEADFIALIEPI